MAGLIRFLDVIFASAGLLVSLPVFAALCVVGYLDTGAPLFRQVRVGRREKPFVLVKFRTMAIGTASVATHLAEASAVTPLGHFLRRTKLDELPQLWNVLKGDMSLVGPRPCLPEQEELIRCRKELDVFLWRPGVTGLAQISGVDMSTPQLLAETDCRMLKTLSVLNYFRFIMMTVLGKGAGDRIGN